MLNYSLWSEIGGMDWSVVLGRNEKAGRWTRDGMRASFATQSDR